MFTSLFQKISFFFKILATAGCVSTLSMAAAPAQEFEKKILTGSPSGTYIQFGRNIADLAAQCGRTLQVQESAGSLENFIGVRKRPNTQFGIVQSDVLEYLRTFSADDPDIARAIQGVRIAFPLYNEEVHLLAKRDVATFVDLEGKNVAIGVENSGTFLTASLVLDLTGVNPANRLTIGPDAALAQLIDGSIDALFYVAGAPTRLFQDSRLSADRFHFLPIEDNVLSSVYETTTLPANTYAMQPAEIPLIAVKAVLMTYEYSPERNTYHRDSCRVVSEIAHLIFNSVEHLRSNGHPKWKKAKLDEVPAGWRIGDCVRRGLDTGFEMTCNAPVKTPSSAGNADANTVYRQRICAAIGC